MLFLPPNQQCRITEGMRTRLKVVLMCGTVAAAKHASISLEPRAPLAEMEDIEVAKKKEKPAAVCYTLHFIHSPAQLLWTHA